MHNAPPVAFPVGRFVWGPALWGTVLTLSGAGLVAWQAQSQASPSLVLWAWIFWALCAGVTAYAAPKQLMRDGQLLWTGEVWLWQSVLNKAGIDGEDESLALSVGLDMGSVMLLWVQASSDGHVGSGRRQCAWVSQKTLPSQWHGFRCAVYSRPKAESNAQEP